MLSGSSFLLSGKHALRELLQWTSMSHFVLNTVQQHTFNERPRGFRVKIPHFSRLSHNSQKRFEYKENQSTFRQITSTPRSHVRVLKSIFFLVIVFWQLKFLTFVDHRVANRMKWGNLALFAISSQVTLVIILLQFWLEI